MSESSTPKPPKVRSVTGSWSWRRFRRENPWLRWAIPLAIILLAFSYPWWGLEGPLSFIFNDGLGIDNDTLFNMSVYVMLALGLNVVVGYAGLLDLGYVAFFALGAYTLGWFGSGLFSQRDVHFLDTNAARLPGIHLSFWVVVLLAGAVCAFAGVLIGWPTLRLRGDYLAIVTLGFGEIIPDVFRNGDDIAGHNLTNGVRGVTQLDRVHQPMVDRVLTVLRTLDGPVEDVGVVGHRLFDRRQGFRVVVDGRYCCWLNCFTLRCRRHSKRRCDKDQR